MKKQNSKLFNKFEDAKILAETAQDINGGGNASLTFAADPTTDNCTQYGGSSDCGDIYDFPRTAEYKDYVMTSSASDTGC